VKPIVLATQTTEPTHPLFSHHYMGSWQPNTLVVVVWVATVAFGIPALDIHVILTEDYTSIK
jgi:hypothetical protein